MIQEHGLRGRLLDNLGNRIRPNCAIGFWKQPFGEKLVEHEWCEEMWGRHISCEQIGYIFSMGPFTIKWSGLSIVS